MLYWALMFLIFSIVAGVFGFGGVAAASAGMAQILFYIFVGLFVLALLTHIVRGADKAVNSGLK